MPPLNLLPKPKKLTSAPGRFNAAKGGWIVLDLSPVCAGITGFQIAEQLATSLEMLTQSPWNIVRDGRPVKGAAEIRCFEDLTIAHDQGYRLAISPQGVVLRARTQVGLFYAFQTLVQIVTAAGARWPALVIEDWPDFPRRGVYLDTARGKVPELGTLLQLIDDLARLKINEIQLYVENNYAFRRHRALWSDTTPFTAEELMMLDAYCKARFIDFVPSLTSLGHFDRILNKKEYRHLGEIEPVALRKIAPEMKITWNAPFTLNVTDPQSKALLKDMVDEFLPNFTSGFFNICGDETWDLGKGKSKAAAAKVGADQLYVDWINFCNGLAKQHGRTIMMWGDIIRDHPDKLPQIPQDVILLEWGYEADHDFDARLQLFAQSGLRFYVCPGTSTWQSLTGRSANAFANMRSAAAAGLKYGALGYLTTDWGDFGHQQLLAVSLLPLACGAALSWNAAAGDAELISGAAAQWFGDPSGAFTHAAYELGMSYQRIGHQRKNASVDFWLLREPWAERTYLDGVKESDLIQTRAAVEAQVQVLTESEINHPDGQLIRAELVHSGHAVLHAIERTLERKASKHSAATLRLLIRQAQLLRAEFAELWKARNKPSRLADILAKWDRIIAEYREAAHSRVSPVLSAGRSSATRQPPRKRRLPAS